MADDSIMTRRTRTRQTRFHVALQSGYCAICHLPYNNIEEHIHSKKHMKLIGEDANYISINGFIDQNTIEPYLSLNGIDSIDVNAKNAEKDDCSLSTTRTKMLRNRSASKMRDGKGSNGENRNGIIIPPDNQHRLRSRKHVNYAMSPIIDDESLSDRMDIQPDLGKELLENSREMRETRTSARLHSKVHDRIEDPTEDYLWNSGRPRRSCSRTKRYSIDEKPEKPSENKSFYKVEVLATKPKAHEPPVPKSPEPVKSSRSSSEKDDKSLIIKFKKLRNAELIRLNNEAENFLFPKKDDSSEDEEQPKVILNSNDSRDVKNHNKNSELESNKNSDSSLSSVKVKAEEEEGSLDSTGSSKKKKRMSHAEAFILDNQKYYKFETPGSRLRYQGSTFEFPQVTTKCNGEIVTKEEQQIQNPQEEKQKFLDFEFDRCQYSFEQVPVKEGWYSAFRRQDCGEDKLIFFTENETSNFLMPYQLEYLPSLDPKICIGHYHEVKKTIAESNSSTCSTPDSSERTSSLTVDTEDVLDEDSKTSHSSSTEMLADTNGEAEKFVKVKKSRKGIISSGKNPRKSPRQHASTLAILSALMPQRKKRTKTEDYCGTKETSTLPTIPEEIKETFTKPEIDLKNILQSDIMTFNETYEPIEIEDADPVEFKTDFRFLDILDLSQESKLKDDNKIGKKLNNCLSVGKRPGRRKKKNLTGWPINKKKGVTRKENSPKDDDSTCGGPPSPKRARMTAKTDSFNNRRLANNKLVSPKIVRKRKVDDDCDCSSSAQKRGRVPKKKKRKIKVKSRKVVASTKKQNIDGMVKKRKVGRPRKNFNMEPYVCVTKLECMPSGAEALQAGKKTSGNQRRMPASPKSPRMLRKPRGRWYKER